METLDFLPVTAMTPGDPTRDRATSSSAPPQLGTIETSANASKAWGGFEKIDIVASIPYMVQAGELWHACLELLECYSARLKP